MRPNLSLPKIAATLAALAACTKSAPPATDTIQKTTDIPSASAVVAQPPPPAATAAASPDKELRKAEATDAAVKPGTIGSAAGKMSCGAGACSGSAAAKKK